MIEHCVARLVGASMRFPWLTIFLSLMLFVGAGHYIANNFAITTDTSQLISPDLDWRQRERQFDAAFPQGTDTIDVVIDGDTPERAENAARKLFEALSSETPKPFQTVRRRDGGAFFEKNGLLYLPLEEVELTTASLIKTQPVLATLAADPTLNGLAKALSFVPMGIDQERATWLDYEKPVTALADAIENMLDGKRSTFSWNELLSGEPPESGDLRRFLQVKPVLDYGDLQPGAEASERIRETAKRLDLTPEHGVRVRLTGAVPMADEEFGTVADGLLLNTLLTVAVVALILWLALRSGRIIFAVLVGLFAGLAMTAAVGLWLVGALNLISVAFAVLFVGIGVDFGIQFSVRYRHERHINDDLRGALVTAGRNAGRPLALAAAATTAGFYAFLPTDYSGVSELGLIAGTGMIIAFLISITFVPAMLAVLNPPGEPDDVGYRMLAPVDRFMARYRHAILVLTAIAVVAGLPLLTRLEFDFNPINLRSAAVESVETFNDLMQDPETAPNTIQILTPSLADAEKLANRIESLPVVERTVTLASFIPDHQSEKLALIKDAASLIEPSLDPENKLPPPTDAEIKVTLQETADAFAVASQKGSGTALAARMADILTRLAMAPPEARKRVETELMSGFNLRLSQIRAALGADEVTLATLPPDIVADWKTADGRARVEVAPRGDGNDNANLRRFASAVLLVAPEATGVPILIQESAKTVVRSFFQAGALALGSITLILFVALRRVSDVLLTLVPLLLAGVVTLELCVLLKLPLNFANIIALPVLLGVGVAFKIYYVLAWRDGETSLLASPLTRAVLYSALTTATAFGSLWFSNHPGTSSMGELLALSLLTTLAAAVLFQPILMGPPRQNNDNEGSQTP
ncbi:hopanoid biosynthesis-associated RND transporter HpnN [Hyphomicrobium methylovorum]|uniref:hopanoid transporter HpnN n=1 Tax=Hyphomicrobium methylovorum TaxID=84 RepID=UPI0015E631F4|nr:MMPL family transporter [Hyphomicrobium methylovorum]MBA2125479.1 hopanoid biosynthesis-associated RND transporter HpnN [Hyphomicrobium methylovorum]